MPADQIAQHCQHHIARPRDIIDVPRPGRDQFAAAFPRRLLIQIRTLFIQRYDYVRNIQIPGEFFRRRPPGLLAVDFDPRCQGQFAAIRLDGPAAGIAAVIADSRRIDNGLFPLLIRQTNDFPAKCRAQHPLVIIFQTYHITPGEQLVNMPQKLTADFLADVKAAFLINSHQLLAMAMLGQADDALLGSGGPALHRQDSLHIDRTGCLEQAAELLTVGIPADDTHAGHICAQYGQIGRYRPSPARPDLPFGHVHDHHRCFRRNSVGITKDIMVDHKIPDQQNPGGSHIVEYIH
ncbi:MAG: hypothetical protein BWY71_01967 [Planctomycetes bacterium ADurb.Bin412]|nr:MAG: hypothetical protein BWY71_01967 [Planctomycetes bacterium ADurb.Bin412]